MRWSYQRQRTKPAQAMGRTSQCWHCLPFLGSYDTLFSAYHQRGTLPSLYADCLSILLQSTARYSPLRVQIQLWWPHFESIKENKAMHGYYMWWNSIYRTWLCERFDRGVAEIGMSFYLAVFLNLRYALEWQEMKIMWGACTHSSCTGRVVLLLQSRSQA